MNTTTESNFSEGYLMISGNEAESELRNARFFCSTTFKDPYQPISLQNVGKKLIFVVNQERFDSSPTNK